MKTASSVKISRPDQCDQDYKKEETLDNKIPDESLPGYFNKKVRYQPTPSSKIRVGTVIAVYSEHYPHHRHEHKHKQLRMLLQDGGDLLVDACEVQIITTVKLLAYQDKNGTIEWTTKAKPSKGPRKTKMVRVEQFDKEIDL